ncbi:MAG: hypothetical protein HN704_11020 [Bacteroidetes bacterium]|jgi:uncharacterized protein (DUF849 family)|nr:hypothetical protein [Bacteroidota bacterium]MBT6687982.1 hypothetical protein [Bacteroidota bacterium]MBT7144953.1 hypothetical protein [Bacteroidota bacterium]MBT7492123.1 hypothetical protein [Bacteroidota bacterium]
MYKVLFIVLLFSLIHLPATKAQNVLQNKNKPLIIMVAQVGNDGWDKNNRGNFVPTSREELIMESKKLIRYGASVIHIHPISKYPAHKSVYMDYSTKNFTEIAKVIRESNPDICFDWCIEFAEDSLELFKKSLFNPYFGSMLEIVGDVQFEETKINSRSIEVEIERFNIAYKRGVRLFPLINSHDNVYNLQLILSKAFVADPLVAIFHFTGGEGIEANYDNFVKYRQLMPEAVKEVIIVCDGVDWRNTAEIAIRNGFHVRVGLHDSDEKISNVEFVNFCVDRAIENGRPIASPFQAKHLLGYLK